MTKKIKKRKYNKAAVLLKSKNENFCKGAKKKNIIDLIKSSKISFSLKR